MSPTEARTGPFGHRSLVGDAVIARIRSSLPKQVRNQSRYAPDLNAAPDAAPDPDLDAALRRVPEP